MRVLLVEDNPGDARLIQEILKENDSRYEVYVVEDLQGAVEHLKGDSFDAILLDLNLPNSEGVQSLRTAFDICPGTPIVVLTGMTDEELAMRAMQEGAQDYLVKDNVDADLVSRALNYAVERNRLLLKHKQAEDSLRDANEKLEQALDGLKKAQTQLVRQEKLASLGELSAGVAHEIKNPLNIISTSVQLLLMEDDIPEETQETYKTIIQQVNRATRITENLREFARRREPQITDIDLHEYLDKTLGLVEYEMKTENIEIRREYDKDKIVVKGDPDQLAQVFLNMVVNARDSMNKKQEMLGEDPERSGWSGVLTVGTRRERGTATIVFRDTGLGIPDDIMEKIFDPFFTTKEDMSRTGLGMSISLGIVENHGGKIDVKNDWEEGVEIDISLPCHERG